MMMTTIIMTVIINMKSLTTIKGWSCKHKIEHNKNDLLENSTTPRPTSTTKVLSSWTLEWGPPYEYIVTPSFRKKTGDTKKVHEC